MRSTRANHVDHVDHVDQDKPIYELTESHTTKSGKTYDKGSRIWLHETVSDGSLARISPYNRRIGLPANSIFMIPTSKLRFLPLGGKHVD